jgi:predicted glutamine amidotransferase
MCGIAGCIIPKYERNVDDFIRSAFVAGSLRGMDSSGIGQVYTDKHTFDSHKLPINGSFFVTDKVASKLISESNKSGTVTICHTRHATVGAINRNTAHPFECYGDDDQFLLGVHNGTLTGWQHKPDASKYSVDSEWALNHILKEKFDAFEDFTGAYCFVWWDADNKENLNIARNKERPMHVVMLKSGGMAYASEAGMLYWLLERHDVEMDGPVLELEADYWYRFPTDNPANFSKTKLPDVAKHAPIQNRYTGSYHYETVVDKVKALFTKGVVTPPQAPLPLPAGVGAGRPVKSKLVSDDEFKAADDLNLLGDRVMFTPWNEWSGQFEGEAEMGGSSVTAVVRGSELTTFRFDEVWTCTVIGVDDDGRDLTLILGPPLMKDIQKIAAAAH